MLTSELIRPRLRIHGSTLRVEMVYEHDRFLQQTAQDLICLFHHYMGQSHMAWEAAVRAYEGERLDYVFIRGLAKVLADSATFTPLMTPHPPLMLRERTFAYGPVFEKPDMFHPTTRHEVLQGVADGFGLSITEHDEMLYADRHASHRLEVSSNYKDLWKFIKLFKLMFWAQPMQGGGYRIDLDGPISPFVTSTLRYGRQLAAFLPALLLCERWQMHAYIHTSTSSEGRNDLSA
jgi:predicted nuclease of restriction endonuclease-like RecB superfamily